VKILTVLGRNIRHHRKEREWTQEDLAEHARIDPKYCGQLERGQVNVSIVTLSRVAKALNQKIVTLLDGAEK
jgi:XRE family transcriptional regulator, regulator of sulfur utilization